VKQWRRVRNKADHEAKQKQAGARERAKRKAAVEKAPAEKPASADVPVNTPPLNDR
jgi:hypothetical protein